MVWAFDQECPSPAAKLVLIKLADHADDDGKCWPSQSGIARDCGLSRQTVNEQIGKLVQLGLIEREQRFSESGQQANVYFLLCRNNRHPLSAEPTPPLSPQTTPPVASDDTEPSIEPSKKKEDPPTPRLRGDDPGFEEFWKAYPHKVGRGQARRAWKAACGKTSLAELVEGVKRYVASKPADRPWRNPSTWLNGECWQDQPAEAAVVAPASSVGPTGPPPRPEDLWPDYEGERVH